MSYPLTTLCPYVFFDFRLSTRELGLNSPMLPPVSSEGISTLVKRFRTSWSRSFGTFLYFLFRKTRLPYRVRSRTSGFFRTLQGPGCSTTFSSPWNKTSAYTEITEFFTTRVLSKFRNLRTYLLGLVINCDNRKLTSPLQSPRLRLPSSNKSSETEITLHYLLICFCHLRLYPTSPSSPPHKTFISSFLEHKSSYFPNSWWGTDFRRSLNTK